MFRRSDSQPQPNRAKSHPAGESVELAPAFDDQSSSTAGASSCTLHGSFEVDRPGNNPKGIASSSPAVAGLRFGELPWENRAPSVSTSKRLRPFSPVARADTPRSRDSHLLALSTTAQLL